MKLVPLLFYNLTYIVKVKLHNSFDVERLKPFKN